VIAGIARVIKTTCILLKEIVLLLLRTPLQVSKFKRPVSKFDSALSIDRLVALRPIGAGGVNVS
jgi:hypothetical protein